MTNNINNANLNPVIGEIPQSEALNTFGTDTIIPSLDPGNTTVDAYSLGQINGDISIQQAVGGSDLSDTYAFSVSETGEYSISLDGLTADADLMVFDAQENLVAISELTNNASESLTLQLNQGDYYVSIPSFDGVETNYNLNINSGVDFVNTPPEGNNSGLLETDEPGDTLDTALDFGTLTNEGNNLFTLADAVSGEDPVDLFKFTVTETQQFNAAIENLTADADLALYDSNNQIIAGSFTDGVVATESFSTIIGPGSYVLGIESYDGIETNYNLSINSSVTGGGLVPPDFGGGMGGVFPPLDPPSGGGIDNGTTQQEQFINEFIWEREPLADPTTGEITWSDTLI